MTSMHCLKLRGIILPLLFASTSGLGLSQVLLDPALRLQQSDMAVLESDEFRRELPCRVITEKPALRFDLRFHANYTVTIPVKDLVFCN